MQIQTSPWPNLESERQWLFVTALLLATVALAGAVYLFVRDWQRILALCPQQIQIQAYVPEQGGWRGGPPRVESGRAVELTVTSVTGNHRFALAHTDVRSSRALAPGDQETVTFVAPAPGRYVLYCTQWCSPDHWRMRTVLEVVDPAAPDAPLSFTQDLPEYELPLETLNLDAPHPAEFWPQTPPSAAIGSTQWQALAPSVATLDVLNELGWPLVTPAQAVVYLRAGHVPGMPSTAKLTDSQRWALVAYLWQQSASKATLARGATLFAQNCADCHGPNGQGNGFAAGFSVGTEPDFTDPQMAAGASPAIYYAKIGRGGMGTGMPNWGTILTEDDRWALTHYLYSFMFDYTFDYTEAEGVKQ